ncbi:hypothetical protein [Sinorhizobium medicae]
MSGRSTTMKTGDHARRSDHEFGGKPTVNGHTVQQGSLVETNHLHSGIDKLVSLIETEPPVLSPHDFPNSYVKARCSYRIQPDLLLAGLEPQPGGREIHIGQLDRALHLKCTVTDQENMGDVRLDPFDRSGTAKFLQKGDGLRLIFGKHVFASSFLAWGHCLATSNRCHFDYALLYRAFDHHESYQVPLH